MTVVLNRDAIAWTLAQVNASEDDSVQAWIDGTRLYFILGGKRVIDPALKQDVSDVAAGGTTLQFHRREIVELLEAAEKSAKHSMTFRLALHMLFDERDGGFLAEDLPKANEDLPKASI